MGVLERLLTGILALSTLSCLIASVGMLWKGEMDPFFYYGHLFAFYLVWPVGALALYYVRLAYVRYVNEQDVFDTRLRRLAVALFGMQALALMVFFAIAGLVPPRVP